MTGNLEAILRETAARHGLAPLQLRARDQRAPVVLARAEAMWLMREAGGGSLREIAPLVGCRFQNVSHHVHKVGWREARDPAAWRALLAERDRLAALYPPAPRGPAPKPPEARTMAFVARARRLWDRGLSATRIGNELGVTRNVVIGLAHRHGFAARPSPIRMAA